MIKAAAQVFLQANAPAPHLASPQSRQILPNLQRGQISRSPEPPRVRNQQQLW